MGRRCFETHITYRTDHLLLHVGQGALHAPERGQGDQALEQALSQSSRSLFFFHCNTICTLSVTDTVPVVKKQITVYLRVESF
jgi:hypothetical protein